MNLFQKMNEDLQSFRQTTGPLVENERARNNVSIDKNHTISCASVKRLNCNLPSGTHIYFNRYQGDGVNQLGSWFRKETLSIALEVSINR